ncbi:ComC/BlpC family leader-containing pheromone/bacteriocin [Bradyrhizobium monzae]|nr:ComC/BlpC family leader-containing pheromone/bacteriocin [Bradyrhizobium sp. Oc8]
MQNKARELTETELETIAGGSFWDSVVNLFHNLFAGAGDLRRPLNRP